MILNARPPAFRYLLHLPDGPPTCVLGMAVLDPRKELQDKASVLKQKIELEEEYQDLINQLQELKTKKISWEGKATQENPLGPHLPQHRVQRWPLQASFSSAIVYCPEEGVSEAFPVSGTTDAQGVA